MAKITTDDCKNFVKEYFGLTSTVSIKRERKYKDANGDVIREFKYNTADKCLIKEDSQGRLSLINQTMVAQKSVTQTTSSFNAKKFLRKYVKKFNNDNYDGIEVLDEYMEEGEALSPEDKVLLANEFYYCFPLVYDNDIDSVTNGLDTPMFRRDRYGDVTYGIFFHNSVDDDPEMGLDEIVRLFIPKYFEKVDETIFEMHKTKENEHMTIRDVIALFDKVGMSYKNCPDMFGEEDDCMLKQLKLK